MNVAIKHKGTTITSRVISYEREHKICTGIGSLTVVIEGTYSAAIAPWDSIDIYENGDYKVRYYVSQVSRNAPDGTIVLECQDISKRVVDYFISDSYTIDYPSYNKYWIGFFLDEAGVEYEFTTTSPGALLSNYTQLGMVSAYDQIQTLLQMSGWYMYFDGNEKAIIGSLDIDLAEDHATVGKTDILDIRVVKNDKMLRNKALVFGAYDPYAGTNAKASVTVNTPWNYDSNDLRPVVISNSNIPDSETAYGMANQIVKEFARITVEKHLSVWGARDYNLGTALRVVSNVWKGRGLITTFGVSMSSAGLKTNIILDERCPRLFGFFDFGDYVYVATYGEGVWRKHIKYDPTWYNFSTGLTNLAITDMHISAGVFGSVSTSGDLYYAIEDLPWNPLSLANGLVSSVENNVDTELTYDEIETTTFSGLMARATIVDKQTSTVKFAVDNASGINYGDYFLDHSGTTVSGVTGSGVAYSGAGSNFDGKRSWIVEYDVLGGDYIGTSYPISLSGCYAYTVLDLDNDGLNDYVSVATSGAAIINSTDLGYNFGRRQSQPADVTNDEENIVAYNLLDDFDQENETLTGTGVSFAYSVFNDESTGEREIVWLSSVAGVRTLKRIQVTKPGGIPTAATSTSPTFASLPSVLAITKTATDTYVLYHQIFNTVGAGEKVNRSIGYYVWHVDTGVLDASVTISPSLVVYDEPNATSNSYESASVTSMTVGGIIYLCGIHMVTADAGAFNDPNNIYNYLEFTTLYVPLGSFSGTISGPTRLDFGTCERTGPDGIRWKLEDLSGGTVGFSDSFQKGAYPTWFRYFSQVKSTGAVYTELLLRTYIVYTNNFIDYYAIIIEDVTSRTGTMLESGSISHGSAQLTTDSVIYYMRNAGNNLAYVYNGLSVTILSGVTSIPFNWQRANIYPMFGPFDSSYIAKNVSTWYWCNPVDMSVESAIDFPANYTPLKPFNTSNNYDQTYYWECTNTDTSKIEILRYSSTGYKGSSIKPFPTITSINARGQICGNFFIDYVTGASSFRWIYVNNQDPAIVSTIYQILQREGTEFKLIEQEIYPMRVDISHNSPVLTVGSGDATFQSNYVYGTELVTVSPVPSGVLVTASGNQVNDYRYVLIEPIAGDPIVAGSGLGVNNTLLYISSGVIYASDTLTYSGGFQPMYFVPSGYSGTRIETSNYGLGGQYIFITAAGVTQEFFQSNPGGFGLFSMYSGMPQSRATIIRLDDSM